MSVSRRKFLRSSAALSAALVLKPATLILSQDLTRPNDAPVRFKHYSRAMFEPFVGDTFQVRAGKQTVGLKLVALTDLKPHSTEITTGRTRRTDCFSLRFESSTPLPLTATTHTLKHGTLGSFELFMIQSDGRRGFLHTAIVNHAI